MIKIEQKSREQRNADFLKKIHKNSRTCSHSISFLEEKTEDENLLKELQYEISRYDEIKNRAENELKELGERPTEESPMTRMTIWSGIQMNTMMDKTSDKIAEILIQGNTMGIVDMTRTLKQYDDIPPKSKAMGEEIICLQEDSTQKLKQYLS